MQYSEIATSIDSRGACALYISENYGEAVVHQIPTVLDTLWAALLSGATEELAQLHILSDHRLPPPNNGE